MMEVRVLTIGDVVGKPGRQCMEACLDRLCRERDVDLTVVNGENAAGGSGLTPEIVEKLRPADRRVLAFQPIQRRQKQLRFAIVNVPHIAADRLVTQIPESTDAVVAVEALLSAVAAALDGCPVDTVRFHAVSLKGKKVLAALAQPWG